MKPSSVRPATVPAPFVIDSCIVDEPPAEGALLLRMSGTLDADAVQAWSEALRGHLERADRAGLRPVLDMAHVQLGGAAVLRTLAETARTRTGRPELIVVRARPGVREAVHLARLDGVRLYATLDEALREPAHAVPGTDELPAWRSQLTDPLRPSYEDLHQEVRALRARVRTAPVIGMAQGALMVRYGLPDPGSAFRVLREASQRFNVPLRVLASAVMVARPPDGEVWFPGRRPLPAPQPRILARGRRDPRYRRQMIDAVLRAALAVGRAPAGYVRCVDPAVNALTLEAHHGCAETFLDHLVRGGGADSDTDTAVRMAGRAVGVPDVATEPLLPDGFRRALLTSGVRALHTVPVLSPSGPCAGVITVHWPEAGHRLCAARTEDLALLAADASDWLSWYHRTVLLDALEHLHTALTGAAPAARHPRSRTRPRTTPQPT